MLWITKRHRAANTAVPKQAVRMWVRAYRGCTKTEVVAHAKTDRSTQNNGVWPLGKGSDCEVNGRWLHDFMTISFTTCAEHTKQLR